jgi:2-methylcitrate dehydratase PrpD
MASGIIEYLSEGTWTKRMHAGWAAQSGLRAALMARGGFIGPRTVLEGPNGVYRAFAPSVKPDFGPLLDDLGRRWVMPSVAFKPYPCGTMVQPFIDCAMKLAAAGVLAADVSEIVCEVAPGTVPRLWEPLASKHRPPTPYAAKFSTPFCMAVGFLDRTVGLAQFSDDKINDAAVLALAAKIRYSINPRDPYPRTFTGHLRAAFDDGSAREYRQPFMRGGAESPLPLAELESKFMDNARYGQWPDALAERLRDASRTLFAQPTLDVLHEFRV